MTLRTLPMSPRTALARIAAIAIAIAAIAAIALGPPAVAAEAPAEIRLYAMDCGHLDFKDLSFFSDTGDYDGKSGSLADPCFLIRHPKGILLWDTGLSPEFAKQGNPAAGISGGLDVPVTTQLQQAGLTPANITYVAFSHFHSDHTGNANLFASATWIINRDELAWATAAPGPQPPGIVDLATFSAYKSAKSKMIDGDYDVFGDGTVRILKAPGHTPGHQVLLLHLRKSGAVILGGDLYHFRHDREARLIMTLNTQRADTIASFDRIEKLAHNVHARLIVQHDPEDFKSLPKFPAYLD
jgi:N-acyl homoserine lactone hydrolase